MSGLDLDALSDEDRQQLERLAVTYAAAVSTYNDLDERITIEAREYADRPWDMWDDLGERRALAMCLQREQAIADLATAKREFTEKRTMLIAKQQRGPSS